MKNKTKINYKLVNFAIIMIILFLIYMMRSVWFNLFNFLKKIILPFLISFLLSYAFYPLFRVFKKKGVNNFLSCFIVITLISILVIGVVYFSLPIIIEQLINLSFSIFNYTNNLLNQDLGFIGNYLFPVFNDVLLNLGEFIYSNSLNILSKSFNLISTLGIIIVLFVVFLFNMEKIRNKIYDFFSRKKLFSLIYDIDKDLSKYLKSISIIFIIELVEYTILYLIIGHPNFLLLGILAGVATIIPYFGGIFTNFVALITALSISKRLFILTSIIAIVMPIFDSYVIDPKIYHKTIKISSFKSIITIIISSSIFGFVGIIIAIPLYIVISKIIVFVRKK